MANPNAYYAIQPAFVGGEVSEDVASRVDLDKYQMALLQAENVFIRPYGSARKRPGTIYCGECKYSSSKAILYKFEFTTEIGYLLEFGNEYLRVWRDGTYLGIEITTPYTSDDLSKLRFVQSIDVLYICSGDYPVKKLTRYSETNWTLTDIEWTMPPFEELNKDEDNYLTPSGTEGTITITADKATFDSNSVGDWVKFEQYVEGKSASSGSTVSTSYTSSAMTASSTSLSLIKSDTLSYSVVVQKYTETSTTDSDGNTTTTSSWDSVYSATLSSVTNTTLTVLSGSKYRLYISGVSASGVVNISINDGTSAASITRSTASGSNVILCGDTWKIITHGTWAGTVYIEYLDEDTNEWKQLRKYTGNSDYNPTESGTVEDYTYLRYRTSISSGSCTVDLSTYPYTHIGYAQITAVTDSQTATAEVKKVLGSTTKTVDWYISAWNKDRGYPKCATFFQNRLCFGGSDTHPQRLWMSQSGDYENFEVEKESGTVTDDSAITADLLSLKAYEIKYMTAGNDLIIFTEGNSWTISGSSTVTPTEISPRNQENYGINDVFPMRIGPRVVYVQRRGSIVRDIGYDYNTDSYIGADLTLLAKNLIRNKSINSASFAQEPDSMLFFTRSDGVMLCLTYIFEQKVYGWSHLVTDGSFESVAGVSTGNNDIVYAIVKRTINGTTKRYIERFDLDHDSECQQDYVMMDCAKTYSLDTATTAITGLSHLEGKTVHVMADNYLYESLTVSDGQVTIPQASKEITVGLPYTMILEQPNIDFGNTATGTMQGREKTVSTAILRLSKSFGGAIGPDSSNLNDIVYTVGSLETGDNVLFSGDKEVTIPLGGYNKYGRVYIEHDSPYPFSLSALIRSVTIGG